MTRSAGSTQADHSPETDSGRLIVGLLNGAVLSVATYLVVWWLLT